MSVPEIPFDRVAQRIASYGTDPIRRNPHQVFLAASRSGKSYLIRNGLMPLYKGSRTIVLDPKPAGGDRGWHGLNEIEELESGTGLGPDGTPIWRINLKSKEHAARTLETIINEGCWVVVVDDSRRITEKPPGGWGLSGQVDGLLSLGAAIEITVIIVANSVVWATSSLRDQAMVQWLGRTSNTDQRMRFLDIAG